MGRLCNQKEIRHQLLTLAGCRVPSRCCFSLFGVRSISALSAFFPALDIIVFVNLSFKLIKSPAPPRSFANVD